MAATIMEQLYFAPVCAMSWEAAADQASTISKLHIQKWSPPVPSWKILWKSWWSFRIKPRSSLRHRILCIFRYRIAVRNALRQGICRLPQIGAWMSYGPRDLELSSIPSRPSSQTLIWFSGCGLRVSWLRTMLRPRNKGRDPRNEGRDPCISKMICHVPHTTIFFTQCKIAVPNKIMP